MVCIVIFHSSIIFTGIAEHIFSLCSPSPLLPQNYMSKILEWGVLPHTGKFNYYGGFCCCSIVIIVVAVVSIIFAHLILFCCKMKEFLICQGYAETGFMAVAIIPVSYIYKV